MKVSICKWNLKQGAVFGISELEAALREKGIPSVEKNSWMQLEAGEYMIAAGTVEDIRVRLLLQENDIRISGKAGSYFVGWCGVREGKIILSAGRDEEGLMYALLELAQRVRRDGSAALKGLEDIAEEPENMVRCMDRYIVGHLDNDWFQSEEFMHYYLQRLAKARFNRFCLILGFDTPYMAPPYPFFLETVDGYEEVKVGRGFEKKDVEKNLWALRRWVDLCHAYSIRFVLATWQQRPWTKKQEELVEKLPASERGLSDYCYAGLRCLLRQVPDIDVISFRVNHESGVGTQLSAEEFWNHCADAVADAGKELGHPFVLDLRAKGLTEAMTAHAYELGLQLEVPTKYWCEHAALPYHITAMRSEELAQLDNYNHSRRYSYADMLEKPLRYPVIFRLWNYGSTNLFLWGDPDYAARFSKSCGLSGSSGFQVNAPLSLKYGYEDSHRKRWDTFADPALRKGKWEDERFFSWYTMFGRLGYNSQCNPRVWEEELREEFGEGAPLLCAAMQTASKILPLITAVHMPAHPSLRYWTELNTGWALFAENNIYEAEPYDYQENITYGTSEPSDHALFYGIDEYAEDCIKKNCRHKYTPLQYAGWLEAMAKQVEEQARVLQQSGDQNPWLKAAAVDFRMLAALGNYHACKIRAALALAFYRKEKMPARLSDACVLFEQAMAWWELLSELGDQYYYRDLDFSTAGTRTRRGTWSDLTVELLRDHETIKAHMREEKLTGQEELAFSYFQGQPDVLKADFPDTCRAGESLVITARSEGEAIPVLHYRHTNQLEGLFNRMEMEKHGDYYAARIPADYITDSWDLLLYVTAQQPGGPCCVYPGIYHEEEPYPYHIVRIKRPA